MAAIPLREGRSLPKTGNITPKMSLTDSNLMANPMANPIKLPTNLLILPTVNRIHPLILPTGSPLMGVTLIGNNSKRKPKSN